MQARLMRGQPVKLSADICHAPRNHHAADLRWRLARFHDTHHA